MIMNTQLNLLVHFVFWFAILYTLFVFRKQVNYRMNPALGFADEAYIHEESDFARQKMLMTKVTSTTASPPMLVSAPIQTSLPFSTPTMSMSSVPNHHMVPGHSVAGTSNTYQGPLNSNSANAAQWYGQHNSLPQSDKPYPGVQY